MYAGPWHQLWLQKSESRTGQKFNAQNAKVKTTRQNR